MIEDAIRWAWRQPVKSATAKFVLVFLAHCLKPEKTSVIISTAEIVRWTGLDRKTVPVAIKELEAQGLIGCLHMPGQPSAFTLKMEPKS